MAEERFQVVRQGRSADEERIHRDEGGAHVLEFQYGPIYIDEFRFLSLGLLNDNDML